MTRRALLGMGSNVGDRLGQLRAAVATLDEPVEVSGVYETEPVGGPAQEPYLNVVVALRTGRDARRLLELCQRLEAAADRVRNVRWGPRTLDVDVLWVDGQSVREPDLQVPHPRMFQRAFVMVPLAEVAPDVAADCPAATQTAAASQGVRRLGDWETLAGNVGDTGHEPGPQTAADNNRHEPGPQTAADNRHDG